MSAATRPLVVVFLRGGTDGLSLLRPLQDSVVDQLRPDLVVPPASTVPAGEGFGLHPALATTGARLAAGTVALVPACGSPTASRSHFSAQFSVERSDGGQAALTGGWLGRHLDATAGREIRPFRAVSLGQTQVPTLLAGSTDVLAATTLADLTLDGRTRDATPTPDLLASLWQDDDGPLGPSAAAALEVLRRYGSLRPTTGLPTTGGDGRVPTVASSAAELVTVFGSSLGTRVGMLNMSGWDHHSDLGVTDGAFARLATELDGALDTLLRGIPGVVVLVVSEFGRRAAANASGGSDHGRGGVAIVLGDGVRGGVHGDWPGLGDLDEGDVPVANDVRSVFAEVVGKVLDADVERILPGAPPPLGLLG